MQNNLFDGRLKPATQFIGNNNRLYTNCNAYDDCDIDWHLAPNASLPDQGVCNGDPLFALSTHWHYVSEPGTTIEYDDYHIINESSSTLTLNIDNSPQSDPIENGTPLPYVIGNVVRDFCSANPSFQNQSCTVLFPIEGAGLVSCDNEGDIERRIHSFLRNNQRDSLLALLHCIDTEWAIRLLVGSYVDERLYEEALAELLRLPNTPENAEFIALYQAIIEGGLEEQGSGKAAAATATVSLIADNALSPQQTLAQSVLAVYKGTDYVRHGATVNLLAGNVVKNPNYKLVPNPAQDHLALTFIQPVKTNQTLEIYSLQGQLVLTQKGIEQNALVNVALLQTGIYFCRLSDEADVVKLVIVR